MFYAIKNLTSRDCTEVEPWNVTGSTDRPANGTDKAAFIAWGQMPNTNHVFYSPVEPVDKAKRVDAGNEPVKLHGIVADYDAFITDRMVDEMIAELRPNWVSRTFSNGVRCVWVFEEPVTLSSKKFLVHTLKMLEKKLKLDRMLPGLDKTAFRGYHMYYELGTDWRQLNADPVGVNTVWKWVYDAGQNFKWYKDVADAPIIPLERVKEALEEKYPGVWVGAFEEGCRGKRFWDPAASNATAAVVRPSGMQCFSGDKSFVTWRELLGSKFVEDYEADRIGSVLNDYYYDSRYYWRKIHDGTWYAFSKEDFRLALKVKHGLQSTAPRQDTASEVEKAMFAVQEEKIVTAALPFVHQPEGFLYYKGQRFLNIASCRALAPADAKGTDWGDGFPWVAAFLTKLFGTDEQLKYLLGWWKHFYANALAQQPRSGQALFLVGNVEVGKTLFSTAVLPMTVGGCSDASSYLLGEDRFNSHALTQPVMAIDDTAPASDPRKFLLYSARVKKLVANSEQLYEAKFKDAGMVEWMGRVVVTCNTDPESIKVLPNLDMSILDKISMFTCGESRTKFPSRYDILNILKEEMPFFCRFLLNWVVPADIVGTSRFGVKPHHAPQLIEAALQSSPVYSFFELLVSFLEDYKVGMNDQRKANWEGTATELLSQMINQPKVGSLAGRLNGSQVSTYLGQLKAKGFPISYVRTSRTREWILPFDLSNLSMTRPV